MTELQSVIDRKASTEGATLGQTSRLKKLGNWLQLTLRCHHNNASQMFMHSLVMASFLLAQGERVQSC